MEFRNFRLRRVAFSISISPWICEILNTADSEKDSSKWNNRLQLLLGKLLLKIDMISKYQNFCGHIGNIGHQEKCFAKSSLDFQHWNYIFNFVPWMLEPNP
jgi:hypothetical protein